MTNVYRAGIVNYNGTLAQELTQITDVNSLFKTASFGAHGGSTLRYVLDINGKIWYFDGNNDLTVYEPASGNTFVSAPTHYSSIGFVHYIDNDGYLWGWGQEYGNSGRDDLVLYEYYTTPLKIGNKKWKQISSKEVRRFGIDENDKLFWWGNNYIIPTQVNNDNWKYVCANFAIKEDGTLWEWPDVSQIQTQIGTDNDWKQISFSDSRTSTYYGQINSWICAIKENGNRYVRGEYHNPNFYRFGDGLGNVNYSTLTYINDGITWEKVFIQLRGGWGLDNNGNAYSWGANSYPNINNTATINTYATGFNVTYSIKTPSGHTGTYFDGMAMSDGILLFGEYTILNAPTGITITNISYTGATINWVNNNTEDVLGNYIQQYSGGTWVNVGTTTSGATNYNITGLTPITEYTFRVAVYNDYMTIPSDSIIFETLDPSPFNLKVDKIRSTFVDISWELPDPYGDEIQVQIREVGVLTTWTTVDTLSNTATSFRIIGLLQEKTYECQVVLIGSEFPSNTVEFYIPEIIYLKSFCEGINYTVTHTTCGGVDGTITIDDTDYLLLFDFKLEDIDGNSYELDDNAFKGLTSNYYFLYARPKQAFWSIYGNSDCVFEWIKIESTDTTLSLTQVSVQHAICQGFGRSRGRIGYVFADSYTGFTSTPDYNLKIYNTSKELVYDETATGLTSPFIFNAIPACYNAVLTNGNDCTYFIENVCVQGLNAMTVEGIDELYLTKYNSDITVNYWGLEDENYYIGGYDSNFYTSTKIKEILNYDIWYQIPLNSADASYSQQLIRGSNGITYEESIDIVVHHKDVQKWLDMIALLRDRYVIVFRDNNENWWTFGYQSGTEIRQYRLEENAYKFTFFQPAVTKLLTAISEDYVNTYIK